MADWLGISGTNYDSCCGDAAGHTVAKALSGTDYWYHNVSETPHWFIVDLVNRYTITQVEGRSITGSDPIDVNIYVSDSKTVWGDAVATGISTWRDTSTFQTVNTTEKAGRYIKVEIDVVEGAATIGWGKGTSPYFTIFDAYGVLGVQIYDEGTKTVSGTFNTVLSEQTTAILEGTKSVISIFTATLLNEVFSTATVPSRPTDYSGEKIWGYYDGSYQWVDAATALNIASAGGGRYQTHLVVIGYKSVYFSEV